MTDDGMTELQNYRVTELQNDRMKKLSDHRTVERIAGSEKNRWAEGESE
jgi:hypothetical protein